MSEHGPATTSEFSSIRSEPVEQRDWSKSAQTLARQAREQAWEAGEYAARNVQEYPLASLLVAGLVGYGIGYLIHNSWSSERRKPVAQTYPHVLRPPGYVG